MTTRAILLAAVLAAVASTSAHAECWRLRSGQVVTTSSNSTPPALGAQRVACPSPPLIQPPKQPLSTTKPPAPKLGVVKTILPKGPNADNCVLFARSRVPSLPTGMLDWKGKLKAVNSYSPVAGSVAMIPYQSLGHVAYVEQVSGNTITLIEANFSFGNITRRVSTGSSLADAAARLKIAGYYRP